MKHIKLTQNKTALVDDSDYETIDQYKWYFNNGYAGRRNGGTNLITRSITMHRFIMNPPKGKEVDHINGNRLDNRRSNLRLCTRVQNMMNKPKQARKNGTTSKYKGVSWDSKSKKWKGMIKIGANQLYLGLFSNEKECAIAYDTMAYKLYKKFAYLNFP